MMRLRSRVAFSEPVLPMTLGCVWLGAYSALSRIPRWLFSSSVWANIHCSEVRRFFAAAGKWLECLLGEETISDCSVWHGECKVGGATVCGRIILQTNNYF